MNQSDSMTPEHFATRLPLLSSYLRGRLPRPSAEWLETSHVAGANAYEHGDYQRAADIFRMLLLFEPESSRAWFALAACHEATQEADTAATMFRVAARCHEAPSGERARALVYLARVLVRDGRLDDACECLAEIDSCDLDPSLEALYSTLIGVSGSHRTPKGKP